MPTTPTERNRELPRVGETFGKFEVLELIGRGGMGQVFKVISRGDSCRTPLALKVVDSPSLSRVDRLRFEREFQLTSRFSHPNLVKVYDFGSQSGTMYFTMEWIKGRDVDQLFKEELDRLGGGQFPAVAVDWVNGILSGLEALHEAGIVHRDLKPENVLVDDTGLPKLLDLGLASHFSDESSVSRLTSPGSVLGTVHFMAPEQIIGAEVDRRSDLYSLGVILFSWCSGRMPFTAPDPIGVLGRILHEPLPPLESRLAIPKEVESLIVGLLSKSPDDRPASAESVRQLWNRAFGTSSQGDSHCPLAPPLEALPLPPRFVGRKDLLNKAQEHLLDTSQRGLCVLFTGSQGTGKSRSLQELRNWAKRRRWKVLKMSASPLDTLPFQPLLEPLRASLRLGVPDSLKPFQEELSLLLPELLTEEASSADLELNAMRRYRLFEGMRRVLIHDRRSTDEPVTLLSFEELQLAGDETLAFLHFLKQRQQLEGENQLLVVGSLGPSVTLTERSHQRLDQTLRASDLLTLPLPPLGREAARELVLSMLGGGELDEVSLEALVRQSEGNPLFLIEMTRFFLQEGRLSRTVLEDRTLWRLKLSGRSESSGTVEIPDNLKCVVRERLQPLDREDRTLLRKAAFLGLRFSFTMLAAIMEKSEGQVLDRLLELARLGLVKEGKGTDTFDFCNSVIPAVLLDSASSAEKRQTHLQICEEALKSKSDETDPFWLAWHYREAGEQGKARHHLLKSAEKALNTFSFAQAAALFREVLSSEDLSDMPPAEERSLQENLADSLLHCGKSEEARDIYTGLFESSKKESRVDRARLLRKLGILADREGNSQDGLDLIYDAWEELGLPSLRRLEGNTKLSTLLKALTWDDISLGLSGKASKLTSEQAEEVASLAIHLQRVLYLLRPEAWVRQGVEVAVAQRQAHRTINQDAMASALADFNGGFLSMRLPRGWQPRALKLLRRCRDKTLQTPPSFSRLGLMRDCGYLLHLAGASEEGFDLLMQGVEEAEQVGHLAALPFYYSLAASVAYSLGRMDVALDSAQKGYYLAEALENRRDLVLTACQLGRILSTLKRFEDVDPLLAQLDSENYQAYPYFHLVWNQVKCEYLLAKRSPDSAEQALALCEEGITLCRKFDELSFQRCVFRVIKLEALLNLGDLDSLDPGLWKRSERKLSYFPHLRFRLKVIKAKWLQACGKRQQAEELLERLLGRPECTPWRTKELEAIRRL